MPNSLRYRRRSSALSISLALHTGTPGHAGLSGQEEGTEGDGREGGGRWVGKREKRGREGVCREEGKEGTEEWVGREECKEGREGVDR